MIRLIALSTCALVVAGCLGWLVRDTVRSWRRQARHAARVITETEAEFAGGLRADRGWDRQVVPYAPVEGHPPWPVLAEQDEDPAAVFAAFDAGPHELTGPPDWREQTAADLSPEALDSDVQPDPYIDVIAAEHISEYDPDDSGPGVGSAPGPDLPEGWYISPWVPRQMGMMTFRKADERLPASLPAIERQFAETMSRLWTDVHGWAGEPWATRMPWEAAAARAERAAALAAERSEEA